MTDNSKIIITLCSHLCAENCTPLEPSMWAKLSSAMSNCKIQPKDLPNISYAEFEQYLSLNSDDIERIKRLFDRSDKLNCELNRLNSLGINIVTTADSEYPKKLERKLKNSTPPLLYYSGNLSLLEKKTAGFVGSRTVSENDVEFTANAVRKVNKHGYGVVSGGAKGADSASREASIANGSFCIEYVPDSLLSRTANKEAAARLHNGQLLIMSAANPEALFNTGFALQRNKFIYIQSEATIAVKSDYNKGGTWSGATDALKKGYCPVFCRKAEQYQGNMALIRLGAIPIDESWDGNIENPKSEEFEQLSLF